MTVRIEYAPGRLPSFWDRSVVFFANLLALFYGNRGATEELAAKVGGIETYGGRLCPLLNLLFKGPENLLVLECDPNESLLRYFREGLGLNVPEHVILHHTCYQTLSDRLRDAACESKDCKGGNPALTRIVRHPALWIDGFVTDAALTDAADILGKKTIVSQEASRRGNNKLLLHRFLEEQGFPVFDTETAECPNDISAAATASRKRGYRQVVVKAQVGASGIGMRKLDAANPNVGNIGEHMFFEGPCLVQGWLNEEMRDVRDIGSPSMQMFLDEKAVCLYDVTEQILSAESVHEGNCAPPPYWRTVPEIEAQMRDQAAAVGQWLHHGGYRGTASADFLVLKRQGQIEVRLCEVNARVTGATYPSVLARRFCPEGSWLMRNLRLDPPIAGGELLGVLRRSSNLFAPGSDGGVLPINFNTEETGLVGKGQFLWLGEDIQACLDYFKHSADVLPVTWSYDRD